MIRLPMSKAGAALLRAILARALVDHDRILLTEYRSTDWQSLTVIGERHEMRFRIPGPGAEDIFARMTGDLTDAEFAIPKQPEADCGGRCGVWSTGARARRLHQLQHRGFDDRGVI
jgi:hypothetical protein